MDVLSDLLRELRPHAHIFFTGEFCGDFAVDTSGDGRAHFHVIARGQCWLDTAEQRESRPLQAGDLVLFPHDAPHSLLPHPPGTATAPDDGYVSLICGHFTFESKRANPLLAALPEVIILRAAEQPEDGWLERLLAFIRHEAENSAPGAGLAIDRLAEVLFLFILRTLMRNQARSPSFLRALTDPPLARALTAMHEQPGQPWTVDSLAVTAALSRTAFANRFRSRVGMTPGAYLSRLRMDLAREWLEDGTLPTDEIALRSGYASTAAFAKAFRQVTGQTPGQVRRAARLPQRD